MLQRTCQISNHQSKGIEFVCIFDKCQLDSRFLCSLCTRDGTHKHGKEINSHILDHQEFYERFANDANQDNVQDQCNINSTVQLNKCIYEIKEAIKSIQNILQYFDEGTSFRQNKLSNQQEILKVKMTGFDQIDEQVLNDLMKTLIKKEGDVNGFYQQLEIQSNLIIESAKQIKQWRQNVTNQEEIFKSIKNLKYSITLLDDTKYKSIYTGAISNDLKYIISGGQEQILKIWDYDNLKIINQIQFDQWLESSKFTNDSSLLYVGDAQGYLHQLTVDDQFKRIYKQKIHTKAIYNIICLQNSIILTSSYDKYIAKTDVKLKQQLFKVQAHQFPSCGLDYHFSQNLIVSGSPDKSIKLLDGSDGKLILEKQNAHNNDKSIWQVIFIQNKESLISLSDNDIIIWNINLQTKKLEQLKLIAQKCYNISLALDYQYIILIGKLNIRFYSIEEQCFTEIQADKKTNVDGFWYYNTVQPQSMQAMLIQRQHKIQVCKIKKN